MVHPGGVVSEVDRDGLLRELDQAPAAYRALLDDATPESLRRRTAGTRWTNREMLFHLLLGYGLIRVLLPLVAVIDRAPPRAGRAFAAVLNAGATPFHAVNYLGSVVGGRLLSTRRMARLFDRSCAALARRLRRQDAADLARSMPFPTRWDPFFTTSMSVWHVYHYAWQHFTFHRAQLTLDRDG